MRDLRELDKYPNVKRINIELPKEYYINPDGPINPSTDGCFVVFKPEDNLYLNELRIIASSGGGWDHVSTSLEKRCPTWEEMEYIARLFFKEDEYAFQLHVPETDHINNHPFVLHWWRPRSKLKKIPIPPKSLV